MGNLIVADGDRDLGYIDLGVNEKYVSFEGR